MAQKKVIDARFVRIVAIKRVITGSAGLLAGPVVFGLAMAAPHRTQESSILGVLALLIFAGGGAWALRDGLRLLRELRKLRASTSSAG